MIENGNSKEDGMKKGDQIVTMRGTIETVRLVTDSAIYTYENLLGWYHPTKAWKARWMGGCR